jgi:uncharacterized protein (DUF2141 family)
MGQAVRHRSRHRGALTLAAALVLVGAGAPEGEVTVAMSGLRSHKGDVLVCLTREPRAFPDCSKDPGSLKARVAAGSAATVRFAQVPAGLWSVAVVHDENGNGKLDTALGIPREGYGFSRDAPVRMGPPKFADAEFAVGAGDAVQPIRMRYIF